MFLITFPWTKSALMKRALPAFLFLGVNGYCNINFFSGPQVAMSRLQATDLLSPCVRFTRISLVQIIFKKSRLSLWTSLSWTVLIILPTEKLPVARYENVTICKESSERECVFLQVICSLEYCYRDTIIISIREEVSSVRQLNPSICWTID